MTGASGKQDLLKHIHVHMIYGKFDGKRECCKYKNEMSIILTYDHRTKVFLLKYTTS